MKLNHQENEHSLLFLARGVLNTLPKIIFIVIQSNCPNEILDDQYQN